MPKSRYFFLSNPRQFCRASLRPQTLHTARGIAPEEPVLRERPRPSVPAQDSPTLVVLGWLNFVGSGGFELATQRHHRSELSADKVAGPFELHAALPRMYPAAAVLSFSGVKRNGFPELFRSPDAGDSRIGPIFFPGAYVRFGFLPDGSRQVS